MDIAVHFGEQHPAQRGKSAQYPDARNRPEPRRRAAVARDANAKRRRKRRGPDAEQRPRRKTDRAKLQHRLGRRKIPPRDRKGADLLAAGMEEGRGQSVCETFAPAAEIEIPLHKPDAERRRHPGDGRDTGEKHPSEPGRGPLAFGQGGRPAGEQRDFAQNQEGGDKLKPAHTAQHRCGEAERVAVPRRTAAPAGHGAEQRPGQHRQQPGPQTPVQILHAALHPGGQHRGKRPTHAGRCAKRPPGRPGQREGGGVEQNAVGRVEHPLPRLAAVLPDRKRLVEDAEGPPLQTGLVGVGVVVLGFDRGVLTVEVAVLGVAEFLGIGAEEAAGALLILLHLEHPRKDQRLGIIVPEASQIGILVVQPEGQHRAERKRQHRSQQPPQRGGKAGEGE